MHNYPILPIYIHLVSECNYVFLDTMVSAIVMDSVIVVFGIFFPIDIEQESLDSSFFDEIQTKQSVVLPTDVHPYTVHQNWGSSWVWDHSCKEQKIFWSFFDGLEPQSYCNL